jgi:hypothetical protein
LKGEECTIDPFFLAMAHWGLGEKRQAREQFEKAIAWMSKTGSQDDDLLRFRAEASALLGISESSSPSLQKKGGSPASDQPR